MLYLVQLKLEGKTFFAYRNSNGVWIQCISFSEATPFKTHKGAWDALKRVHKYCNESGYDSLQKVGYEIDVIALTEAEVQSHISEEEQRRRTYIFEDNKRKIYLYGREAEKQVMEFFLSSSIGTPVRIYKKFSFDWELAEITNINSERFEVKGIEFELLTGKNPDFLALPPDDEVSEAIISQQLLKDFTANYWKWNLTPEQQITIAKILATSFVNS
ncbi:MULTISPECIES: hypothetical protein [unclassified Microcoleus]|uniref:hypothetical protein n=1 Tax=unclassified Microcoleus TaxID=2642155 RepID=UPI002FD53264